MDNENLSNDSATSETPTEQKSLGQDEVNRIVQREKASAREKGRKDAEAEYQQRLADNPRPPINSHIPNEDDVYHRVKAKVDEDRRREDSARAEAANKEHFKKVADEYYGKISAAKDMPDDFKDELGEFDHELYPVSIFLANKEENTAEVAYELAKNPYKASVIETLYRNGDERAAKKEMGKLVKSISKQKNAIKNNHKTQQPLSRMKPSTVGTDNGEMTIADYKKVWKG